MRVQTTSLAGVLLFVPTPHRDERGWFSRTFDAATARAAGVDPDAFLQDSQSRSAYGVIRGMHGRRDTGEAKLVRCAHGAIHDVVVDARPGSPTFGQSAAFLLDDEQMHALYIPRGFLHGFQALTQTADTCYRIDAEHAPSADLAVAFDDPELGLAWPLPPTLVSARDRAAGSWAQARRLLTATPVA
ncbi:MAG TPA: dTDP-4-dehydrorhamnose 3,5-epimerase family protein [Pseudonocardia sp.]